MVDCFGDMLSNFFQPLFEATLYPDKEENQDLAWVRHCCLFCSWSWK